MKTLTILREALTPSDYDIRIVDSIFMRGMKSRIRTNDDKTSPSDLVDEVDLELGVCPSWICSYYCYLSIVLS